MELCRSFVKSFFMYTLIFGKLQSICHFGHDATRLKYLAVIFPANVSSGPFREPTSVITSIRIR
jgi:hypothetical protein